MRFQLHIVYRDYECGAYERGYLTWPKEIEPWEQQTFIEKELVKFGYESWDDFMKNNGSDERDFIRIIEREGYAGRKYPIADFSDRIPEWAQNPSSEIEDELRLEEFEDIMIDALWG